MKAMSSDLQQNEQQQRQHQRESHSKSFRRDKGDCVPSALDIRFASSIRVVR